jgi:ADP-heptose:LPS heptosyltransferase
MSNALASGHPLRVIVSRTDRIGDVVLTLPLCAALRRCIPGARVIFLARAYTKPVVDCSPFVDEVMDWDDVAESDVEAQATFLSNAKADVILHVAPRREIARAAKRARIRQRIGTSHRLFHWTTCTDLVSFSRKRSALHEAQLDLTLARDLLGASDWPLAALAAFTELRPRVAPPATVAARLTRDRFNLVVHPRSSGSSMEWPLDDYRTLVTALDPTRFQILITGSPDEARALHSWTESLGDSVVDLMGRLSLDELIAVLHASDGFVGGSTGPLHLAAGVGIHALGLYPARRPMHAGRWAPLGPRAEWLSASEQCERCQRGDCHCLRSITPAMVQTRVHEWADGA